MAKRKWTYDWPRPAVTVDIALFTVAGTLQQLALQVLLICRAGEPFRDCWALPGGFVLENEDLHSAALRELAEETGVPKVPLYQVGAVGTPGRDPRGHTVTVLWAGLMRGDLHPLSASGDAGQAKWFGVNALPDLAFDHGMLLRRALQCLQEKISKEAICAELLPGEFTMSEFQALVEAVLQRRVDRRNFRRRVLELAMISETGGERRDGAHRPARLYRFVEGYFEKGIGRDRELPF